MGWFGRKKEEKKKFDYSEETKELFAERDAYYAEQRRKLGGGETNPELANQKKEAEAPSREENLDDLLGGTGDFNPYVNKDESTPNPPASIPSSQPSSTSSAYTCSSCGKEFQEKWGKCPSCGGEMKKAESQAVAPSSPAPIQETSSSTSSNTSVGDPLDDLLGDFSSSSSEKKDDDSSEELPNNIRMVSDDDNGPSTDFGAQRSSHSNRKKVRKVRKVKRPRNP
ncbi:MAG: hypothetical protein VYE32_03070 [Candidatus Thermoplasmatota archaeon]|nr:hypothetical protein [Candidatus Thermoplasmatota archaeon]